MEIINIIETNHTLNHWVFYFSDGSKNSVGKYTSYEYNGELIEDGVSTEEEAIILLKNNFENLI